MEESKILEHISTDSIADELLRRRHLEFSQSVEQPKADLYAEVEKAKREYIKLFIRLINIEDVQDGSSGFLIGQLHTMMKNISEF